MTPPLGIGADGPEAEPVFAEPWQAQAFAIAVQLHARGLYTWPEWAQALAQQIASDPAAGPPPADGAQVYYRHWLAALEQLVADKGAATRSELTHCQAAWNHAADRTAHGQPIVLRPSDFGAPGSR